MSKRANQPLDIEKSRQFKKDWESLNRSGRYNMNELMRVVLLLASNTGPLPTEYGDHPLIGNYKGFRDCHIGGDFLLIYKIEGDTLYLTRTGTHAELFGK